MHSSTFGLQVMGLAAGRVGCAFLQGDRKCGSDPGELVIKNRDRLPSYEQKGAGKTASEEKEIQKSIGKHGSPLLGMYQKR